MSKWTLYQLLIVIVFGSLVMANNLFKAQVAELFSFVDGFIAPSIVIIFFSVVLIIWGFSIILLLQEKKGKPLFTHKIWRIMPAIMTLVLLLSVVIFIALGVTVLSDISESMKWIIDLSIAYFLIIFYLFTLSIVIRYGKSTTAESRITKSANAAVIILLIVILLIPALA